MPAKCYRNDRTQAISNYFTERERRFDIDLYEEFYCSLNWSRQEKPFGQENKGNIVRRTEDGRVFP